MPIKLSVGCGTLPPLESGPNFGLLRPSMIERAANLLLQAADRSLYAAKHTGVAGEPQEMAWNDVRPADAAAA